MQKQKMIQIPETLFFFLIKKHLLGVDTPELETAIIDGLNQKLQAMNARSLYMTYKTGETEQKRETARIQYLRLRGIPESFIR